MNRSMINIYELDNIISLKLPTAQYGAKLRDLLRAVNPNITLIFWNSW